MTNAWYTAGLAGLQDDSIDLNSNGAGLAFVYAGYTFDAAHTTRSQVIAAGGDTVALTVDSVAGDTLVVTVPQQHTFAEATNKEVVALVLYENTGTYKVLAYWDVAPYGLPAWVADTTIDVQWASGSVVNWLTETIYDVYILGAQQPRHWGPLSVLEWAEAAVRDNCSDNVAIVTRGMAGATDFASITPDAPASAYVAARSEGALDERQVPPQSVEGVWLRVTQSELVESISLGDKRAKTVLEAKCFCDSTDAEDSTPPTTQPSGYKKCQALANAVDLCLRGNLDTRRYGVQDCRPLKANLIPRPLRRRPSTHVITLTYEVRHKVHDPTGHVVYTV